MAVEKWNNIKLQPGETIVAEFKPSLRNPLIGWVAWGLLALLFLPGLLVVIIPAAVIHVLIYRQNSWALTNQRLLARLGWLNKRSVMIGLERVQDTEVIRPFMSGLFGTGQVLVSTAGGANKELRIWAQDDPDKVSDYIESELRKRKGLAAEGSGAV
jgi:membrane protein YdbS with pleckstrin-like domain